MARARNVVILSDYAFPKGGAELAAINSSIALSKAGLNVTFFSAVGPVCESLEAEISNIHCLDQHDIVSDANRLRALLGGLWNREAKTKLAALLSGFRAPDTVVHVHQWNKALTSSVFDAAAQAGLQTVVTLHDYFIACPNGGFLVYPKMEICERQPLSVDCILCNCDVRNYGHKMWRVARHAVQNKVYGLARRVRHFIYVTEFSRKVLEPHVSPQARWYHVSNAADVEDRGQVDVAVNNAFLFVGRLSPEKGATLFAEAARLAGVPAVFVGDGAETDAVRRINPDAVLTGWLDKANVAAQYRAARALVFPSLWYEAQGMVVLEALSLGVPTIVSDHCAAADMVSDRENGYIFKRNSAADLAAKMTLLKDGATARTLSAHAYRLARANPLTMDAHVRSLINVYDRMLAVH